MRIRLTIATVAALAALAPTAALAAPSDFVGADWDGQIRHAPAQVQADQFARMAAAGVRTTRISFLWAGAQPWGPGATSFKDTDPLVAMAATNGISLLPIVIEAPGWARASRNPYAPPRDPRTYAAYLTALIERYGANGTFWADNPTLPRVPIRTWQIWNEPDLSGWWASGKLDWARSYAALLRTAYVAAKRADPTSVVVLGALTNYSWKDLAHLYRFRTRRYFDVAALDPYTTTADDVIDIIHRVRQVMRGAGDAHKPVWITEFGLPASRGKVHSHSVLQTTDAGMARFLEQTYARLARDTRKYRVGRAYWFTWASPYAGTKAIDLWNYAGLIRWHRGKWCTKPAYVSFLRSARRVEGAAARQAEAPAPCR